MEVCSLQIQSRMTPVSNGGGGGGGNKVTVATCHTDNYRASDNTTSTIQVMVSNLPLLFARGSPTSLESMCLEELQLFLKFVLKCEHNSSALDLATLKKPAWWPKGVSLIIEYE